MFTITHKSDFRQNIFTGTIYTIVVVQRVKNNRIKNAS